MVMNYTQLLKVRVKLIILLFMGGIHIVYAQMPARIKTIFPTSTVMHQDIAYANDTLKKHLLDLYIPAQAKGNIPLIIWIHGGAWMQNDKYADMGYMKNTIRSFIDKGYALASVDYRFSTTAIFPAQVQDCNQAIEFLYQNAGKYKLDTERFVLIGFSAGGHLASLLALSNNNKIKDFYPSQKQTSFKIKAVLDFYGPSDLLALSANLDVMKADHPLSMLLGSSVVIRPDLAKFASPANYVDKNDPPFLIIHGEKDESVPYTQSVLLQSYLNQAEVKNQLIIVEGAPHYGEMFDTEQIRSKLFLFLDTLLK